MLTINPVKLQTSKRYISFGDGDAVTKNMAILALQNPNARREFEGNLENAIPTNPISTVIKKIARTYKYVVASSEQKPTQTKAPDQHISFLG